MNLMEQYANIYGVDFAEVKEWVKDYSLGNVPESVKELMEPTKEERINSIKEYIQNMVDDSITSRIKGELIAGRMATSEVKVVEHSCPF
jgi:hypothetical protein